MKKFTLIIYLLIISTISHAGWIIGSDSLKNGVIKVEKNAKSGLVIISKCEYLDSKCKELVQQQESTFSEVTDYAQLGGSFLIQAAPTAFFALASFGDFAFSAAFLDGAVYGAAAAGYLYIITNIKSLNIIRLYDYSRIQRDSFLTNPKETISFPDDSIKEIIAEIVH